MSAKVLNYASPTLDSAPPPLRRRAVRSSIWTVVGFGGGQVLRLGSNLILTRLLSPPIFGLMTLVNTVLQGLQMFSDVGIGPSIIQNRRGEDPRFLNTAWTIQSGRGVALWLCACLLAHPVARIYEQPQLAWLLPAAGLAALIAGFNSTAIHTLNRKLMVGRITLLDLSHQAMSLTCIVIWAWFYPTVWALVGGTLVGAVYRVVCTHTLLPGIRNRFCWDREATQMLFRFGRWVFLSTILTFLSGQADRLIFGKMVPLPMLGVYGIAAMMATLPTQVILKLGSAVVFPAYSQANSDPQRLASLYGRVRRPLLAWGGLAITILIAGGPALIRLMYDARYEQAAWMVQILAAGAWFQILTCTNDAALLSLGATQWLAAGNAAKLLGMLVLVPLGYKLDAADPFRGAVCGLVLSETLRYAVSATAVRLRQLSGWRLDGLMTLLVAATSLAALVLRARLAGEGRVAAVLIAMAVSGAVWLPVAYLALRREIVGRSAAAAEV